MSANREQYLRQPGWKLLQPKAADYRDQPSA